MRRASTRWALVAVVLGGCGGEEQAAASDSGDPAAQALAALQSSPCDEGASALGDSVVASLLVGAARVDPEVGDCQRLAVDGGSSLEFGPLVGLFPVDAGLRLARSEFHAPKPVVAIYSWGAAGGTYAASDGGLATTAGASCVWLANGGDAPGEWRAAMATGAGCGGAAAPPADSSFTLAVFERVFPATGAADYPRSARWEWDLDARRQVIGVKCGDAWCRIAPPGSRDPRTQPLVGGDDAAREKVPGWSDAQFLAVWDSAAGKARPGPWAAIVAYRGIAAESPPWVEGLLAARMTVYGDPGAFADRFYLQPEGASGHDDLILRFPGMQDEAWLQQGPMRRRKAKRIQFMPTPAHVQVGAARWRWGERGETVWTYCPTATCAVEP